MSCIVRKRAEGFDYAAAAPAGDATSIHPLDLDDGLVAIPLADAGARDLLGSLPAFAGQPVDEHVAAVRGHDPAAAVRVPGRAGHRGLK